MPIADWRDGTDHIDATIADSLYDPAYLRANIAGGEGFDWYYASYADRIANNRSPIADATYGEPWIWRFKDLVNWWSNTHHNRIGGTRVATATAWVPGSKPLWLTELGAPAVDKAANQPNVFPDPKSAESARPYFSNGAPDALAQRQVLRAHLGWWHPNAPGFADSNNPPATAYSGRMLDPARIYLWTWDARPYPAFPNDTEVWADAPNYATGRWLNGRLGALASDELVRAVAADYGVAISSADARPPLVFGLDLEGIATARDALQPLLEATGLAVRDTANGLAFGATRPGLAKSIAFGELVDSGGSIASRKRPDSSARIGRIALGYTDRERDYLTGTVTAMRFNDGATSGGNTPLVLDLAGARVAVELQLAAAAGDLDSLDVTLPPSFAGLEVGDVVAIAGQGDGPFVLTELRDGTARRAALQAIVPTSNAATVADRPLAVAGSASPRALPVIAAAHLPADPAAFGPSRLLLAANASPWPGSVEVTRDDTGAVVETLGRVATMGELLTPLPAGASAVWDGTILNLRLYAGHLAAADDVSVLAGTIRLALQTDSGSWEIIGFAGATLTAPATYQLSRLLRGQGGTGPGMGAASAGNRVVLIDNAITFGPVATDWLGESLALHVYAGRGDPTGQPFAVEIDLAPDLPLPPVHLTAGRDFTSGDIALSWYRCSRSDTDSWALADAPLDFVPEAYTVTILKAGAPVRTLTSGTPAATYTSAQQITDFGSLPSSFAFSASQGSALLGPGNPAHGAFNA